MCRSMFTKPATWRTVQEIGTSNVLNYTDTGIIDYRRNAKHLLHREQRREL